MSNYEYCILNDPNDIVEYEKGLYLAFGNDNWFMNNYIVINNERLKSKIPYEKQIIFVIKENNIINCAMAINLDRDNLQLVNIGFPKPNGNSYYEGINLFYKDSHNFDFFSELTNLFNLQIKPFLIKNNIKEIYATCDEKLINMFYMGDWEIIEFIQIGNDKEYLIKLMI